MARHKKPSRPTGPKKPPLTHFLCLPLVNPTSKPQLEASLAKFKDDVTSQGPGSDGEATKDAQSPEDTITASVHAKAIRPVGALHCTLGVMSLKQEELKAAVELLNSLNIQSLLRASSDQSSQTEEQKTDDESTDEPSSLERPITPPAAKCSQGALTVDLKGLQSMHAPHKTSILYTAPSDASDRLYNFCLALQKVFKERGLLVEDNRELKLHATIVNTIYAKSRKRPPRGKHQQRSSSAAYQGETSSAAGTEPGDSNDNGSSGHGPNANAPLKIDATQILEKYRDYVWADNVILDRVAICEMGAKKILDDQGNVKAEEYTEVASVALPT